MTNQPGSPEQSPGPTPTGIRGEDSSPTAFGAHASVRPAAYALLSNDRVPATAISFVAGDVSVQDRIALSDARLRGAVAIAIVVTFVIANGIVLAGVWLMFGQEMSALQNKAYAASDRVVTSALLMTLVGATTVQLGALTILMGKYLFPTPKP